MAALSDRVILRSWPKLVFIWPTAAAAFACGLAGLEWPELREWQGAAFLVVFAANAFVLSFEFGRAASLAAAFAAIGLGSGAVLLNQRFAYVEPLSRWLASRDLSATPDFYFGIGGSLASMLLGMFVVTRFDYWVLSPNELVHKRGLLGDLERFPTTGLKLNKEIHDVFEYLIARAGRVVLAVPGQDRPIVLENVIGIQRIERRAAELLNASVVRLAEGGGRWPSSG